MKGNRLVRQLTRGLGAAIALFGLGIGLAAALPGVTTIPILAGTPTQWQQTSGPGGGVTTALHANGNMLFAGNFEHFSISNTDPDAGTLYRSTDHGQHWTPANTGFTGVPIAFANNATSLFVATRTDGIFRSMDDGGTWTALAGTNTLSPNKLLYANGVLYVGSGVTGGNPV